MNSVGYVGLYIYLRSFGICSSFLVHFRVLLKQFLGQFSVELSGPTTAKATTQWLCSSRVNNKAELAMVGFLTKAFAL